ncbi:MAG: hypothetical protein KJ630_17705 [Proteobacteria bacterium]|nr:hypothetical protein [Pseudomonadota bacterium]
MTNLNVILVTYLLAFMILLTNWTVGEAGVGFLKVGDTVNIAGQEYTLKYIDGFMGIYESVAGKYYVIETAIRKDEEYKVLTEVTMNHDNTVSEYYSSFEFGKDFPNPDATLRKVALIPKINAGKVMDRIKFVADPFAPKLVTGLLFYYEKDSATFSGKEVTLDHFENEKAIWKGSDNKYYLLEISEQNDHSKYVLKKKKKKWFFF